MGHGCVQRPIVIYYSGGWGGKTGAERRPPPGIQAHAPTPHARHDRSMARSVSVARPSFETSISLRYPPRPTPICVTDIVGGHCVFFCYHLLDVMESSWHLDVRGTLYKQWFCERHLRITFTNTTCITKYDYDYYYYFFSIPV